MNGTTKENMKNNENTNRILTLMGLSLLAMASEGNPGQYDDAVRLAMMKATGIEQAPEKAGTNSSAPSPSDYCFGVRQLADYLGISPPTCQRLINEGKLDPAMRRVGRKYSFLKSKVDEIFTK